MKPGRIGKVCFNPYKITQPVAKLNWWIELDSSDRMKTMKHCTRGMRFHQLFKFQPLQPIVA